MKLKIFIVLWVLSGYVIAGSINIAVAANVSFAMNELKKAFHILYPDTVANVTLGSSGKLTAQIKNCAPYELFMAANMMYPKALYKEGLAVNEPVIYAQGGIAFFSGKKQDFTQDMKFLDSESIKKIALANPKTAPYGKAAIEAMQSAELLPGIEEKFVYAETVSQTVTYAITAADVGFIAKSSLYSPTMSEYKKGEHWADVDTDLYTPINQGIVILKEGKGNKEVKAFYDFMQSPQAKKILQAYGYLLP
ncbi:MAG TPA: molybdate ABC transporter substrate-binding protein [Epsilonproteobacteria bacterium]|nr:molybdate ABC transporter substrate-binding protein [Campylobacterota bacterium]